MRTHHIPAGRHPREQGFTLVELLVVIVILGILAGVVVFAVRGSSDKGEGAAVAADERTIRTAQEAYCARFGRYASEEAYLVNPSLDPALASQSPGTKGFLSEESESHDIGPPDPGDPKPCGGTGYKIIKLDDGVAVPPPPPGKGTFADHPDPLSPIDVLVPLPTGKVLAWGKSPAEIIEYQLFDPVTSQWTSIEPMPHPLGIEPIDYVVLLDDPSTPLSDCAPNCGSVLVKSPLAPWFLFNAEAPEEAQWTAVAGQPSYSNVSFFTNGAVQLMDDPTTPAVAECGLICGQVFVTAHYGGVWAPSVPVWELYNPHTNAFTTHPYPPGEEKEIASATTLAPLRDGRVLMVGVSGELGRKVTKLFDPADLSFTSATDPEEGYGTNFELPPPALANGDVLFERPRIKEIYRPERGGPGTWLPVDNCAAGSNTCEVLALLADRTVFAHAHDADGKSSGNTFLLEAREGRWKWRDAAPVEVTSARAGALIDGRCDLHPHCGKVLVAGTTAQLYTPP